LKKQLQQSADNGSEWAKAQLNKKSKTRQCSFCRAHGHDRRKCEPLAEIHNELSTSLKKAKDFIVDKCREHNFGVGSLVSTPLNRWTGETYENVTDLCLVQDIMWDKIQPSHTKVMKVSVIGRDEILTLDLPAEVRDFNGKLDQYYKDRAPKIVSGESTHCQKVSISGSACFKQAKEVVKNSEWSHYNAKYYANKWRLEIGEPALEGFE
tara:strand:- start:431 stop:1057 length:627 start_codon:yes stop_codon:yes gene_type:complete